MTPPTDILADDQPVIRLTPAQRLIAQGLIMAATALILLDQTIATVALPHMQAALSATPDTISWVLTSYILSSAVAIPMTAWLSERIGRRLLFGGSALLFTLSSAACAFSISLPMIVAARVVQGFFGAFLVPMSQSFMLDINRPSRQVRALTMWGLGVMIAPVLGPVVGGYLTSILDWRWVFLINVPIGIVAVAGIFAILPETARARRPFDHVGYLAILVALCSLQLALDRGTQKDWFESAEIIIEVGLAIAAFWMLLFHLRHARNPIISTALFRDRNFMGAMVIGLVISPITVASAALLPPLMQTLLHYPVLEAGLLIMPRGIAIMISMMVGARLLQRHDSRIVVIAGLVMIATSLWLQTGFSLEMDERIFFWSGIIQGLGLGLAVATANLMSMANIPVQLRTEAAAVYMLARNIGASILVSVMSALLARNIQVNHAEIGSALGVIDMPFLMPGLADRYGISSGMLAEMANAEVTRQAVMIAYIDDFWLMMWMTIAVMPVVFLLRRMTPAKGQGVVMGE